MDVPDVYGSGSQPINWDFALFSTSTAANYVSQQSSLPLSSSAALTGSLTSSPDLSLNYATSWDSFALQPSTHATYLGNDSQLLSGGTVPYTTSDDSLNLMAISTSMGDPHHGHFSTPMVKGKINT